MFLQNANPLVPNVAARDTTFGQRRIFVVQITRVLACWEPSAVR